MSEMIERVAFGVGDKPPSHAKSFSRGLLRTEGPQGSDSANVAKQHDSPAAHRAISHSLDHHARR